MLAGLAHRLIVRPQDVHPFGDARSLGRDIVPKTDRLGLHVRRLLFRNRGQRQLGAIDAKFRLAAPVPVLAVVV